MPNNSLRNVFLMSLVLLTCACGGSGGGDSSPPAAIPNTAPTAADAAVSTAEDTVLSGSLPAATDAEGNSVSYSKQTDPMQGTATVSATGSYTYTPAADFNGGDSFTYRVSDGSLSNTYTVSITVTAVNDDPTLAGTAPAFEFTKGHVITAVGAYGDGANAMAVDPMDRIVVTGGTDSSNAALDNSAVALARYTTSGLLDTTFGTGGITTTQVEAFIDSALAIALDSADRIVVAGYSSNGSYGDTVLLRYTSTGVLDPSFGGGDGIVVTSVNGQDDYAVDVALDSSGNIVVLGQMHQTGTNNLEDIFVARYTTDGVLDTTFGTDGIATITGVDVWGGTGSDEWPGGLAIDSSGRILVSGLTANNYSFVVARLTSVGEFDTTFGGGDGVVTTPAGSLVSNFYTFSSTDMALDINGRILVVGVVGGTGSTQGTDIVVLRYTTDGVLDAAFGGGGGFVLTAASAGDESASSVVPDSSGGFVVAGQAAGSGGGDTAVARYVDSGNPDSAFGGADGIVVSPIAVDNDWANAVALDVAEKVLVAGTARIGGRSYFAVSRYLGSGAPDDSFFSVENSPFELDLAGRFADVEDTSLTLTVTMDDDSALPSGIDFDTTAMTVTGRVPPGAAGLKATATDTEGASVSETYLFQ